MISFKHKGNFKKTEKFFDRAKRVQMRTLEKYGQLGVDALKAATPVDTGLTADSWIYEIQKQDGLTSIIFSNTNVKKGWFNVAIMLQMGHGTKTGGWVEGRDYINPAIQPVFDQLVKDAWEEVNML